jgi:hypothetical protein
VLGQRTTYILKPSYYCLAVAFVGGLFTLLAVGIALFVIAEKRADSSVTVAPLGAHSLPIRASANKDSDNDGRTDETSYLQEIMLPARAELDNDLDNDGNLDGLEDPLVVGLGGLGLLVLPSVGGSLFLLSLYKLPMVGGDYYLPLERPG